MKKILKVTSAFLCMSLMASFAACSSGKDEQEKKKEEIDVSFETVETEEIIVETTEPAVEIDKDLVVTDIGENYGPYTGNGMEWVPAVPQINLDSSDAVAFNQAVSDICDEYFGTCNFDSVYYVYWADDYVVSVVYKFASHDGEFNFALSTCLDARTGVKLTEDEILAYKQPECSLYDAIYAGAMNFSNKYRREDDYYSGLWNMDYVDTSESYVMSNYGLILDGNGVPCAVFEQSIFTIPDGLYPSDEMFYEGTFDMITELTPEPTTTTTPVPNNSSIDKSALARSIEKYYNQTFNTNCFEVVDSEIYDKDYGYIVIVRTTGGSQANVLYASVEVNISTGVATDEFGATWNINDYL